MNWLCCFSLATLAYVVSGEGCNYDGKMYEEGASFPSNDGCKTCYCEGNGFVSCTEGCLPGNSPDTCLYNGQTYHTGDSFPAIDKCNHCTCERDQKVACTKKACVIEKAKCTTESGEEREEGDTIPAGDGCNNCICTKTGMFVCTLKACEEEGPTLDHGGHEDGDSGAPRITPALLVLLSVAAAL